jgi:hypothetical protein
MGPIVEYEFLWDWWALELRSAPINRFGAAVGTQPLAARVYQD